MIKDWLPVETPKQYKSKKLTMFQSSLHHHRNSYGSCNPNTFQNMSQAIQGLYVYYCKVFALLHVVMFITQEVIHVK